ncbi:uncharacterized protein LOC117327931 [Pecten maximus]|uniref:uncharacterized protein LOC117327931 n=1 Tax=Pecten maximus TaxID=6579 RepID=UPI00145910BE|nr:uncharacterized protein LOC117327931 [Pecten maximus]
MKKEISEILGPRVEKLRLELRRQVNEIDWTELSSQLQITKSYITELAYLTGQLMNVTDISYHTQMSETYTDTDNLLTNYEDWLQYNSRTYVFEVFGSALEFMSLYWVLSAEIITKTTAMVTGFGFLVGIGFSAYDLYTQINEEKKIRDNLKQQTSRLTVAINEIEKNMKQIVDFKSKYIKHVVNPLQTLLGYFPNQFPSFHVYLNKLNNPVNINSGYIGHMNTHLANVTKYLRKTLNETRHIIEERERYTKILKDIRKFLDNKRPPSKILAIVQKHNNSYLHLHSNFDLLRFIAINLKTNISSCYWGIRMDLIRRGQVDKANYTSVPLCRSPELEDYEQSILTDIHKTMAPCRILRRLKDDVFDSMYKLIKYIADFILPHRDCYWGYDLAYIRSTIRPSLVFESMKLDAQTVTYLGVSEFYKTSKGVGGSDLCQKFTVCEERWQKFIYCSVYPISGSDEDMCAEEKASDCKNMASVYEKDDYCYESFW